MDGQRLKARNEAEDNAFNRVKDLGVMLISLNSCILRLFVKADTFTLLVKRQLNTFAEVLPKFLNRIIETRLHITNLMQTNANQAVNIDELELRKAFGERINRI